MKRYIFSFSLSLLFLSTTVFGMEKPAGESKQITTSSLQRALKIGREMMLEEIVKNMELKVPSESPMVFPSFYTDGRMWGGSGIHEFLPNQECKAKKSLRKRMEFEKTSKKEQLESASSSDLDLISFVSYDVD